MAENDKNKKDLKKLEEKKRRTEQENELEKMLRQVEEQFGIDRSQVRIVRVNTPPRNFTSILIDCLVTVFLNLVLILSISGYMIWYHYDHIFDLVWFILAFTAIELLIKYLISFMFRKLVIRTFGLILALSTLIAIPLVVMLTDFIVVTSIERLLLMFIILVVVRSMIKSFFARQRIQKFFNRRGRE